MSCRRFVSSLVILLVLAPAPHATAAEHFPSPRSLRPQVAFWKKIFAVYSEHQILIHDSEHLGRVYSVLDYRDRAAAGEGTITLALLERSATENEKERIRALLLRLDARQGNPGGLDDEERKIWNLFAKNNDPRKFAAAAERVRAQRGLKERFAQGIRVSRRYLAEMEEIFRREGLPVELTRLPLVESCFDIEAYSKVGAAGIWQFMPSTGRSYMRVGAVIDERRDPLRATRGAAMHLRDNYDALGSWPLAITAYNHGRAGIQRAIRETGSTEIGRIVKSYRGPLFGFASRNFYAEFLAALEVERDYRTYFGELSFEDPFAGDEVQLDGALAASVAASCADVSPSELAALNPAVDSAVFRSDGNLPRGYLLRVPPGTGAVFTQRLAQIASDARVVARAPAKRHQTVARGGRRAGRGTAVAASRGGSYRTHRVARGQTLSHIAQRYRVSVRRIMSANSLRGSSVRPGQVLRIPAG